MSLSQFIQYLQFRAKGGYGSGDWGHRGRPGIRGGSGGGGGLAGLGLTNAAAGDIRRSRSRELAEKRHRVSLGEAALRPEDPQWLVDRINNHYGMAPAPIPTAPIPVPPLSQSAPTVAPTSSLKNAAPVTSRLNVDYGSVEAMQTQLNWDYTRPWDVIQRNELMRNLETTETGRGILNYLRGLSQYKDDETGLSFDGFDIKSDDHGIIEVKARIYDKAKSADASVGNITRSFDLKSLDVHHDWMKLYKDTYQNSGFGLRFYHESEKAYMAAGFKTVTLQANLKVGGYAWARMGFDIDPKPAKRTVVGIETEYKTRKQYVLDKVISRYKETYGVPPAKLPTTMIEAAVLTGPDGKRIGKLAMLNKDNENDTPDSHWWMGIKRLDPNDANYQIGVAYYRSKGVNVT